jgi:hypothetical protein
MKFAFKDAAAFSSNRLIRQVESRLSPATYYRLLALFYWPRAAFNLAFKKTKWRLGRNFYVDQKLGGKESANDWKFI